MNESLEAKKLLIIRILQILENYSDSDHPLKQEDIIKKLYSDYGIEAERKSIGRNITLLQEMFDRDSTDKTATAIAIESDKRRGTYIDKRLFEDVELRLLIDSVLANRHISESHSRDLIEKLETLSNKYFKKNIKHICTIKDWGKTDSTLLFYNIELIDEAIERNRQITFDYNKYGADKKLHKTSSAVVSPYQLLIHNQHYYLVMFNEKHQTVGHYRIDKISNIKITDNPSTPLKSIKGQERGIDYKKYTTSLPYMFTDPVEQITLICEEFLIDQVIDWFGKNIDILDIGGGKYEITLTSSPNAMEYWAMQYMKGVEIKSPLTLREKIKKNLSDATAKYSK